VKAVAVHEDGGPDGGGLEVSPAELLQLLRRQRAHRAFAETPVDDEMVGRCLRAATFSPSSENLQPWVFVVVREQQCRDAIGEIMARIWSEGGREYTARHSGDNEVFADVDRGIGGGAIAAAPVLVVVGGDTVLVPRSMLKSSIFPAVQNLLLAATAEGLGSALTTIATLRSDELAALVGFPEHVDPVAVVPLGWPARRLGVARRLAFAENTFRENYGVPWENE
jgi:nitroreductase